MSDATLVRGAHDVRRIVAAAVAAGEIRQGADGRAEVKQGQNAAASGDTVGFVTTGIFTVTKAASVVIIDGAPLWWDHSANAATPVPQEGDRDFFLGTAVCPAADAAAADTTVACNINVMPVYKIDLNRDPFRNVTVKTVVGSTTIEIPRIDRWGSTHAMIFGATAEAQKLDLLSEGSFTVNSNWVVEGTVNILDDGDAAAIDFNIGVANATHASNADTITESCFFHMDGNAVDILAESDDGVSVEVAATDTTLDYTLGTPFHFTIDGRNPADIQMYVNGVLVLGSTVFRLDAATGPLKLLAHLEKSSDDTIADYRVTRFAVRTAEQ